MALGGDSDTLACINGGIAEAFYKDIPEHIRETVINRLPEDFVNILRDMLSCCPDLRYYEIPYYTPDHVSRLKDNEIFVFGSNLNGFHGGGAAKIAMDKFGAVWGQGTGLQGQSYAIPTMHGGVDVIKPYVDEFLDFAEKHPELHFLVTRIGCGIAGFTDEQIAPLFRRTLGMQNVSIPKSFYNVIRGIPKKDKAEPRSNKAESFSEILGRLFNRKK